MDVNVNVTDDTCVVLPGAGVPHHGTASREHKVPSSGGSNLQCRNPILYLVPEARSAQSVKVLGGVAFSHAALFNLACSHGIDGRLVASKSSANDILTLEFQINRSCFSCCRRASSFL